MDKEQANDSLKNPNKNFNENYTHNKNQIIIDGVNVSRCKFFNDITESYYCFGIPCKDRPNCYFKQLARKTQECEKYKKRAVYFKDVNKQLGYKYLTIKQECEELKEKNALLESQMAFNLSEVEIRLGNEINRNETLLKELKRFDKIKDEFREMSEKLKIENIRYRKALEEIENLMQTVSDADECSYGDFDCCNCDSDNSCPTKVKRLILDIINKAKGEGNEDT